MLNNETERKINKLKIRRTVYIVLAAVLVLLNLFVDIIGNLNGTKLPVPNEPAERLGYYLGSHFFIVFALFLVFRVVRINKKIRAINKLQMDEIIDEIGNN